MDLCQQLHDDPSIRALLWCLISSGELNTQTLKECSFSDTEAHAILKDEHRLLRRMKQRHAMAQRMTVKDIATLLRNKLSEHIENTKKATELSSILRCLKGLPDWLFPEWEKQAVADEIDGLLKQSSGALVNRLS